MKATTYGQKGGEGPTKGKASTGYIVTLPDGRQTVKRVFAALEHPVGYAYQHEGNWFLSTVAEKGNPLFARQTECPARKKGK